MANFKLINYDNCITNLTSSVQLNYGLKPNYKTNKIVDKYLKEKDYQNVIVMVFDGMGNAIIDKNTTPEHYLQIHRISKMISTFPPTTANCTTAYISGLNPVTTGWLGWSSYLKDRDICIDNFPNVDTLTKQDFIEKDIAYKELPFTELGDIIEKETGNVKYYTVYPKFKENGCKSLSEFAHRIVSICKQKGKKYIYAYWDEPDMTMHMEGTKNNHVKKILDQIAKTLEYINSKTKDTICLVSADHGQVDVAPIALYTYYDLYDCLKRPFTCDSRTAFFFIKEGKETDFVKLFKKNFKDYYDLYTKQEIIDKKVFGPGDESPKYKDLIGDYVAIAKDKYYFMLTPDSHNFLGHHAGLLKDEMSIPIIIVKN